MSMAIFWLNISQKRLPPAGYANETEAENEAAILLAESLEHRQRTPEEDALVELLIILIEKFEETSYPLPNLESDATAFDGSTEYKTRGISGSNRI
jgi:hypothetical protein